MLKSKEKELAVVHEWLITWGGSEEVFYRFLQRAPREAFCLFFEKNEQTAPFHPFFLRTTFFQKVALFRKKYPFFLFLMPYAFKKLAISGELLLTNCHAFAKCTPKRGYHICYCYTPVRYLWVFPSTYLASLPPVARPFARALMRWLRKEDQKAAHQVDRFVAISKTVQARIARVYGLPSEVIYPPLDTEFFQPGKAAEKENYYLTVSRLTPYKKVHLIIAACEKIGRKLIVVGEGPERKKLEKFAGAHTTFLPFQRRDRLKQLYQRAHGFIFAAFEDFGLAPLEALACGTPVVAYARGGVAEYLKAGVTGTLFFSQKVEALIEAIESFEKSHFPVEALVAQAAPFSLARFQKEWDQLLQSL